MPNIIYDANFNGPEAVPFIGEAEKYHYVYLIVNTLNQKLYIGVHSTKKLNDGYMSSSGYVHEDIDKFGIENFKKYNLFYFNTRKEALDKENELVTKDFCLREDTYNIAIGGGGIKLALFPEEIRRKISESQKGKTVTHNFSGKNNPRYGIHLTEETKRKISESLKANPNRPNLSGENNGMYGKKHTKEAREKMSKAHKGKRTGKDNSMYGKKHTKEAREKMSKARKGEKNPMYGKRGEKSPIFGAKNPKAKAILKFDLNNNFICEFSTIKDAFNDSLVKYSIFYSRLRNGKPINGFYYRYKEENK